MTRKDWLFALTLGVIMAALIVAPWIRAHGVTP